MTAVKTRAVVIALLYVVIHVAVGVFILVGLSHHFSKSGPEMPWVGVEAVELTPELQTRYDLKTQSGVLVSRVFWGSPAEIAGLKEGDVIRRLRGVSVTSLNQFGRLIKKMGVREEIRVEILQNGKLIQKSVTLGTRPGAYN
ncbi:MAG: PDZ domain-containing protein [Candidatus Omnitrophica bacterium]|nr:PDZ domain-containing protein [Candidatus Omnitrophota bacterium]